MLISVCIPVYNFNIVPLVRQLQTEIDTFDLNAEIVIIDDASQTNFQEQNNLLKSKYCKYIQLTSNIGRSAIRNRFLEYAIGDYLLFLDCDGLPISNTFLSTYLNYIQSNQAKVICGGRGYQDETLPKAFRLRQYYGIQIESKSAIERSKSPNKHFMTNNFLIQADLFRKVPFREEIRQYGHEDTVFGYELDQQNVPIHHIENCVQVQDRVSNTEFLIQTKQAILNLHLIQSEILPSSSFSDYVKILRIRNQLSFIYRNGFNYLRMICERACHYLAQQGNVIAFQLYKILIKS